MIEYLTLSQVAEKVGITTNSVLNWVNTGRFPPPFYVGKRARWLETEIDDYFTAQRVPK